MSTQDSPPADEDRGAERPGQPTDTEDSPAARLADRVDAYRHQRAQRRADRAAFARHRDHGLNARHTARLRHLAEE